MLPDRVSNPGPLTYESGALPIALRGPASTYFHCTSVNLTGRGHSQRYTVIRRVAKFLNYNLSYKNPMSQLQLTGIYCVNVWNVI